MAVKYLAGDRLIGTAAERAALTTTAAFGAGIGLSAEITTAGAGTLGGATGSGGPFTGG